MTEKIRELAKEFVFGNSNHSELTPTQKLMISKEF